MYLLKVYSTDAVNNPLVYNMTATKSITSNLSENRSDTLFQYMAILVFFKNKHDR